MYASETSVIMRRARTAGLIKTEASVSSDVRETATEVLSVKFNLNFKFEVLFSKANILCPQLQYHKLTTNNGECIKDELIHLLVFIPNKFCIFIMCTEINLKHGLTVM